MSGENSSKLNRLLTQWPAGAVYTSSWLQKQGIGLNLLDRYRRSGWLYSVGRGAVARSGDEVDWTGGVFAIQEQLKLSIHPAGKTALEMSGYGHFLQVRSQAVYLFGEPREKLPEWFKRYDWKVPVRFKTTNLFSKKKTLGMEKRKMGAFHVWVSSAERAIMEVLHLVPHEQTFEESTLLMENLATLRPSRVQQVLESCRSAKVNRLFMFLAEQCEHSWVDRLNLEKVYFGKGKRVIVKGGRLNPKYEITVPQDFELSQAP